MEIDFMSTVAVDADTIRRRASKEDFVRQDSLPGLLNSENHDSAT